MITLQMLQQAQAFLTQKNYEKVIEMTTDVLLLISTDLEKPKRGTQLTEERLFALQLRCSAYLGNGDYEDALSDADVVIQLLPNGIHGYFYRGTALLNMDELDEAKEDFNHLLSYPLETSVKAGVYFSLGLAEYIASNYEASLRHNTQAVQLKPPKETLIPAYVNMGIIHFRQKDMAAAWNAYKTAQQGNPTDEHVLIGLAVLHAAEGQWDEALVIWHSLASQYPFFTDINQVVERYYRWTPPMADLVRQIAARASA